MRLLSTSEVCEMLGISKATLYRWNNIIDNNSNDYFINILLKKTSENHSPESKFQKFLKKDIEILPKNFPRPFKIGRAYKWRSDEIESWLETMRVRDEEK